MHLFQRNRFFAVKALSSAVRAAGTIIAADTAACVFFNLIMKEKYQNRTYRNRQAIIFRSGRSVKNKSGNAVQEVPVSWIR